MAEKLVEIRKILAATPGMKVVKDEVSVYITKDFYRFRTDSISLIAVPETSVFEIAEMDERARALLPTDPFHADYHPPHRTTSYSYHLAQEYGLELPNYRINEYGSTFTNLVYFPDQQIAEVYLRAEEIAKQSGHSRWGDPMSELQPLGWAVLHDRVAERWKGGEDLAAYYLVANTTEQKPANSSVCR